MLINRCEGSSHPCQASRFVIGPIKSTGTCPTGLHIDPLMAHKYLEGPYF